MKKFFGLLIFISVFLFSSCSNDLLVSEDSSQSLMYPIRFKLRHENYSESNGRQSNVASVVATYDKLFFYIADENGNIVETVKMDHNSSKSEIYAEGLHEGEYNLLVLGIKGDESEDMAEINKISSADEEWLSFPSDLHRPLQAEYFYSSTPFVVETSASEFGETEIAVIDKDIMQKRIIGRLDFDFIYNNEYVRNATVDKKLLLTKSRFYTSLKGNGDFDGESDGVMDEISLNEIHSFMFMPTVGGSSVKATVEHSTVNYLSEEASVSFDFEQKGIFPNNIHNIENVVNHPDDNSPVMYITLRSYNLSKHYEILSDKETKDIYTDRTQRSFNTSRPLQISVNDNGELHARFYSPRVLYDATIKVKLPSVSDEYFDFAHFDSIPAFADFYETTPMLKRSTMCRLESGRYVNVPKLSISDFSGAEFVIESTDPYWEKIKAIKHGWNIFWGLFNGDPDREDGGPVGNWMGIRPVHCRESVAFFLNFTYLIDMEEHEQILRDNAGDLYDDNRNPVKVEQVLAQMRQERTLQVGLVYPGNGVVGLGSPTVFGAYQDGWFSHYSNTYACNVMFHELGHVMGYGHNSSFTYGPWAERLMNNFYVQNISKMPIDSPDYLKSKLNPNKY